jgi:ElaB/YqjD/DUF883 family membrane-anchored ribosome-binding protein/uncharacterized membrane protein YqjE
MSANFESLKADQKHLANDMRTLINDAEALLKHAVNDAGGGYDDARSRLEKSLKSARAELEGAEQALLERARHAKRVADEYVQGHPWESVGVGTGLGAAVGFLLGMLISRRLARLSMSALRIMRQRLELASIDVEEELLRLGLLLVAAMIAALTTGMALLLIAGSIVIYFWDTARWGALVSLCVVFSSLAAIMAWKLTTALREKPRFMAATLKELERDSVEEGRVQNA